MNPEQELTTWLSRKEKTFEENLNFAIKAWNCVEFIYQGKYEIIMKWFCKEFPNYVEDKKGDINWEKITTFLTLKFAGGLISNETKQSLIDAIVDSKGICKDIKNYKQVETYKILCGHDSLQNFYKMFGDKYCNAQTILLDSCNKYLQNTEFSNSHGIEIAGPIIKNLVDFIKRSSNVDTFSKCFTTTALQSIVELVIYLSSKNINYFNELLEIGSILYFRIATTFLKHFCSKMPTHVSLKSYECLIYHFKLHTEFIQLFIRHVFKDTNDRMDKSTSMWLIEVSHVLNLFRKYDINLTLEIEPNTNGIQFLSKKIENYVNNYYSSHLLEIFSILCSTIKLNPMIVEQNIFRITAKFLLCRKSEREWSKYQEFVVLFINMFKKLNRPEKLVAHMIKSMKDYLNENKLSKKLKHKIDFENYKQTDEEEVPPKKIKIQENNDDENESKEKYKIIENVGEDSKENIEFYMKILLNEFIEETTLMDTSMSYNIWTNISFAWPESSAGVTFSKFISTLMSKPSLVIWKTLLYSLRDTIELLKDTEIDENLLFLIEFNSALLCQYFAGTRLPEQADIFWLDIEKNQALTRDLLIDFGRTLLNFKHNTRTMNSFLEICYYAGCFDLIIDYYCPDSISSKLDAKQSMNIHSYLNSNEWTLIEQRIVNFGKNECKTNINRLYIQKLKSRLLFSPDANRNVKNFLLSSTLSDYEQIKAILEDNNNLWLINILTREERIRICELILDSITSNNLGLLKPLLDNYELLEIFVLTLYKRIANSFESKKSTVKTFDYDKICNNLNEQHIMDVINAFNEKTKLHKIKKYSAEDIENALSILQSTSLGFCKPLVKAFIFACNLALYEDLRATNNEKIATLCLNLFKNLLYFGPSVQVFEHLDVEKLIEVISPTKFSEFYELIFRNLKNITPNTENFLQSIINLFTKNKENLNDNLRKLIIIFIETLQQLNMFRKIKKFFDAAIQILFIHIKNFFKDDTRDNDKDREFVEQTLSAYSVLLHGIVVKKETTEEFDAQFRKICKIYIGHSMNYYNPHTIKLLNIVLFNRTALHFYPDEIEFILQKYWNYLTEDLKSDQIHLSKAEPMLKIIIDHKTDGDFKKLFVTMLKNLQKDRFSHTCKVLSLIARCQLSTPKIMLFNEYFKMIIFHIVLNLKKESVDLLEDEDIVLNILESQKAICENKKIAITPGLFDDILAFMMDLNIKKIQINDKNINSFQQLHDLISEICIVSMKFRYTFIADRIPQFIYIFRDLLQSICWYKSDRQKEADLDKSEVDNLANMAHKLENLMHLIVFHEQEAKKLAPFLLTFIIGLMVTNKRPTTLYPKVKTHIENICYDLISICDPKVENFILRNSNEAAKQVYETLCKEYKKYHKFRGKV